MKYNRSILFYCLILCLIISCYAKKTEPDKEQHTIREHNKTKSCPKHAELIKGECRCSMYYVLNHGNNTCLRIATTYGDDCVEDVQCSKYLAYGGVCKNQLDGKKKCVCDKGYHYLHGTCHKSSGLGEKCHLDDDCYAYGEHQSTKCDKGKNKEGICVCDERYYQREYRTCRPVAIADNEECLLDSDCDYSKGAHCLKEKICATNRTNTNTRQDYNKENFDSNSEYKREHSGVKINHNCTSEFDCEKIGNSICGVDKKCICSRAYFPSKDLTRCIPELGETCLSYASEGNIKGSICRYGVWGCKMDRIPSPNNRECVKVARELSDSCMSNITCLTFGPDAYCANVNNETHCTCNERVSYWSEKEKFCWIKKGLNDKCSDNKDCFKINATCSKSQCSCPKGTTFNSEMNSCLKNKPVMVPVSYGDECNEDIQCSKYLSTGGICKKLSDGKGECVCNKGYHYLHGRCYKSSGLGEKCESDDDCYAYGEHQSTKCNKERVCVCNEGYYQREHRVCRPVAKDDEEECFLESDCRYSDKARCFLNKCMTNNTLHVSIQKPMNKYENKTVAAIKVYGTCTQNSQCKILGEAICDTNKKCVCNRAYFASANLTQCIPELGERCTMSGQEGPISGSVCRLGAWGCRMDRIPSPNNRECVKVARELSDSCMSNITCLTFGPDAYCANVNNETHCTCNGRVSYWSEKEKFCWIKKGLNDKCLDDKDCFITITNANYIGNCSKSICSCPRETHLSNNLCVKDKPELGNPCKPGSSNNCTCQDKFVNVNGQCLPVASFNSECRDDKQCSSITQNAVCRENNITQSNISVVKTGVIKRICSCKEGYYYTNNSCHKGKGIGEKCTSRTECQSVDDLDCINGVCCRSHTSNTDNSEHQSPNHASTLLSISFGSMSSFLVILIMSAIYIL